MAKQYDVDAATFVEANELRLVNSGTGAAIGNATLVGGTVDVANTAVTANSYVILSRKTVGGTAGNLTYVLDPGVKFTIGSSSGSDTSVVTWVLVQPAGSDDTP